MFVRIVREKSEALYECDRVLTCQMAEKPHTTHLTMEGPGNDCVSVEIPENEDPVVVYFMNQFGRTIDRRQYGK